MSWAQKRKFIYIGSIVLLFLVFVVLPMAIHYYKAPTCFDGKKNQAELGVDCGGPCTLLCAAQYAPLNVLWSRFSKVNDGIYNVLAYIENPNLNAGASNVDYLFKLYDKDGVLLAQRTGHTFAPANKILAIFEADLSTGKQVATRVDFSFISKPVWLKQDSRESGLSISQTNLTREDSAPRLSATLTNKTIKRVENIEAIAIIYNAAGNTIAFSRTVVDSLGDKESKIMNFNWPKPFGEGVARSEIVIKILK